MLLSAGREGVLCVRNMEEGVVLVFVSNSEPKVRAIFKKLTDGVEFSEANDGIL